MRCAAFVLVASLLACAPPDAGDSPGSSGSTGSTGGAGDASPSVPLADLEGVDPDIVRAVEEARARVAREPESSQAWGALGDRYSVHQFTSEAAVCYLRAEQLDPDERLWPYRMGWTLITERPGEALAAFERALPRLEDYAPMHEAYAQTLFRLGRAAEAREHFEIAARQDPDYPHPVAGLGQVALSEGDFEAAAQHFEEALQRDADHPEAHLGLAQAYQALGRTEDARRHAERSRQLPQMSERRDRLGNPIVAPAGACARADEGRALEKAKRFDEAIEAYRIAIQSDPHYYIARKRLAMLFRRRGRKPEAEALLLEGLELDPGSPMILADLEKVRGQ